MFKTIIENVREKKPLVQAITNYVTVNDCANIILACGGSPIMADNPEEAEEIASISAALVINIGTPNPKSIKGMFAAGKASGKYGHPVVLDPVGAGVSEFRNNLIMDLLKKIKFSVLRGNISEIKFLAGLGGKVKGVDADETDAIEAEKIESVIDFAKKFSAKSKAIVAITGATDIVANEKKAYIIHNGHPLMTKVTGTGCMLSGLTGAFAGANPENLLEASACAVAAMGICGELAHEKILKTGGGTGSLRTGIIDFMSSLDWATFEKRVKIETC